jgi:hypothetical protein
VKAKLRGLRDTTKGLLFLPDTAPSASINTGSLYGEKVVFSNAGLSGFAVWRGQLLDDHGPVGPVDARHP